MAEHFEITDAMRAVIGVQSEPWTLEVTTTSIRAFARGVGYQDPVYFDLEAAAAAGYPTLPAPPTYLGTSVFHPVLCEPTYGVPRRSGPKLEHGLPGLLDGGTETIYERTPLAGDVLTTRSAVVDLETKQSGSLGTMLVVTTETTYTDAEGQLIAKQRSQAIYY
jgi:acyl dehydratase